MQCNKWRVSCYDTFLYNMRYILKLTTQHSWYATYQLTWMVKIDVSHYNWIMKRGHNKRHPHNQKQEITKWSYQSILHFWEGCFYKLDSIMTHNMNYYWDSVLIDLPLDCRNFLMFGKNDNYTIFLLTSRKNMHYNFIYILIVLVRMRNQSIPKTKELG